MKAHTIRRSILAADLIWTTFAMGFAHLCRYGWVWREAAVGSIFTFLPVFVITIGLWTVLSSRLSLDGFRGGWHFPAIVSELFLAVSSVMVVLFGIACLRRDRPSDLVVLGYFGIAIFLGFVAIRFAFRRHFKSLHQAGAVRRIVIVGEGALARELASKIERHPEMLCQVAGFLCPAEFAAGSPFRSNSISAHTIGVVAMLRAQRVNEIIVALPKSGHPEILDLAANCRGNGIAVSVVPHPYELYLSRTQLIDLDGLPLLQLHDVNVAAKDPAWQRFMDLTLASFCSLLAIPAVLVGAGLLQSKKGRAFCGELRCCKGGKPFWMYRMNSPRYVNNLPLYEMILQHLSVTELPQLWNVLRGDMSLVGPRPESPEKVKHYSDWQKQRLNVKPGITGLAQVNGLRDQHSSEDKTRFDLQYVLNRSLFSYISLLLQTFWTIAVRLVRLSSLQPELPVVSQAHSELSLKESFTNAHSTQSSAD